LGWFILDRSSRFKYSKKQLGGCGTSTAALAYAGVPAPPDSNEQNLGMVLVGLKLMI
jgi:hypothetical protein